MEYAYKFRIYPSTQQEQLILRTFGCARYVYNYYLNQRIQAYKTTGKSPTRFEQDKDLTSLKKQHETSWLKEVDKCALQNSLKHLDIAYKNFCVGSDAVFLLVFRNSRAKRTGIKAIRRIAVSKCQKIPCAFQNSAR